MRFCIDEDSGHVIRGWVAPDNPLAISRVAISVDGQRIAEIAATRTVPGVRQNGWHATGQCEFVADESNVPDLARIGDLEIHDVDTNVLVHRRTSAPGLCQDKLVLINSSIHPEDALQTALYPHFVYSYFGIGGFSEHISLSLFGNVALQSLFLSGSFIFPRYEAYTSNEMTTAMLVHDPYVEMANRLIWLRDRARVGEDPMQRWRLGTLAAAAAFAKDYDLTNIKHLKRFLRMLPQTAYRMLYNPTTRMLGTYLPEDQMMPLHSVLAVEALARIGIVGHADYFEAFVTTLYDRLGIDARVPAQAPIPAETQALADRLQSIKAARDFVVFDAAISDGVRKSVARNWVD